MVINVPVYFHGVVEVTVPNHLNVKDAALLAEKVAQARILATTENPDAPECDAFDDYQDECSAEARETADKDWDETSTGVGGAWSLYPES